MQPNLKTIRDRRLIIIRQLDLLSNEDAELEMAELVLARLSGERARKPLAKKASVKGGRIPGRAKIVAKSKAKLATSLLGRRKALERSRGDGTSQRDLVLAALKKARTPWLNVKEIIQQVKSEHGKSLPPRSLSPLLSILKNTGAIIRDGRKVALPDRAKAR